MKSLFACLLLVLVATACGDDDAGQSASPTAAPSASVTRPASRTATPTLTNAPTPAPTARPAQNEPLGFPLDPQTRLGVVNGDVGSRTLVFDGSGPTALDYATNDQPAGDSDAANRSGWNCRVHLEYESAPAVDFYIPEGTPLIATMDGVASLQVISYRNDFDRYGVSREPYLGDPDRSRAPYSPFPGDSGGLGVYVQVRNEEYATEYGHLNLDLTIPVIDDAWFIDGYARTSDYASLFAEIPQPRFPVVIASWGVRVGDLIGMSGDSGYSEGPHLHYTVARVGDPDYLCPTTETDFADGGWLLR